MRNFVDDGGLMSYGPLWADLYRRAATYVDKILKGAETHFTESGSSPPAGVRQTGIERPKSQGGHRKASHDVVYLTPAQVAELLQVSTKTISRWALQDASMPALRKGRVLRFERDRLFAWLARLEPRNARRSARAAHATS